MQNGLSYQCIIRFSSEREVVVMMTWNEYSRFAIYSVNDKTKQEVSEMGMNQTEFFEQYTELDPEEVLCIESYAKWVTKETVNDFDVKEQVERILRDPSLRKDKPIKDWWVSNIDAVTATIVWLDLNTSTHSSYPVLKYYYLGDVGRAKQELDKTTLDTLIESELEENLLLLRMEFCERIHSKRLIMGKFKGYKECHQVPST